MTLKICMQHRVLEFYQICSNDDPGLTLICFMTRSNLVPYAFIWEKVKTMDFSETIVGYDIKVQITQIQYFNSGLIACWPCVPMVQITQIQYFYNFFSLITANFNIASVLR